MDFYGIDYNTIFSYVQRHWPWALPYIQFLMYSIPVVLFVSGKIANRMPPPGYQIMLFSDAALLGKLNTNWYNTIDRAVRFANQFVVLANFILTTRPYAAVYHILGALGNRVKKEPDGVSVSAHILPPIASHDDGDDAHVVTADNLTAEQIQSRAKFLSEQLASASVKTLRTVAAQKVVQLDITPKPDQKDVPKNG